MSTLMKRLPGVKILMSVSTKHLTELVEPYQGWHLVTVDDQLNLLLTKHAGKSITAHPNDLIILVGVVAKEWLRLHQDQSQARL